MEMQVDRDASVMLDMFKALATQNPGYAIAYALLELARQQHAIGEHLDDLAYHRRGRHRPDAEGGGPGTTEMIGMQLRDLVGAVNDLGQTLAGAAGNIAMDYVTPVEP